MGKEKYKKETKIKNKYPEIKNPRMSSKEVLILLLIIVIIVVSYVIMVLYSIFEQFLFEPKKEHIKTPSSPHKKIMIEQRLSSWRFDSFPGRKTVLFCHGNYGNISYTDFVIKICHRQKLNLLVFDYSGYGTSLGVPSQRIACDDGEAAYKYLRETLSPDDIIVWGMSMGGAVATYIASRNPCHSLILMSTFSSLDDIVRDYGYGRLTSFLVNCFSLIIDNMPSKHRIRSVKCPIAIVHSKDDELIPYSNAQRLYNAIQHSCKQFIDIGGGHVSPIIEDNVLSELFTFCCLDASDCHLSRKVLKSLKHVAKEYKKLEQDLQDGKKAPCYSVNEDESLPDSIIH